MFPKSSNDYVAQLYDYLYLFLDSTGLSMIYKSFVCSCMENGHLLYFGAARSRLDCLDVLQHCATSICNTTFPFLQSRRYATAVGLVCRLLNAKSCGDLQLFHPHFLTDTTRKFACLNDLSDPA